MLVERDAPLAALRSAVERARSGTGAMVFVSGEAGIGKTSLVRALLAGLGGDTQPALTVRTGACENVGASAAPLGVLLEALPEIAQSVGREAGRRAVYTAVCASLDRAPAVVVLEDLHWADEASIDALRYLGRRIGELPLVVVGTCRDDETPRGHPLAVLLGDLATSPDVTRVTLRPLSAAAVRTLADAAAAEVDADELCRRTGGNAFFVTEALAGDGAGVPDGVRDTVLARVHRLDDAAQRVLAAAAVLGARADLDLLQAVSGEPADAVDRCAAAGMLVPAGTGLGFRHELAREAVAGSLAPGTAAGLHRAALAALAALGIDDDARLAHHAERGGDRPATLEYAERAATRAAALGAHREAGELLRAALRSGVPDPARRMRLHAALSYECYLTGQLDDALAAQRRAVELAQLAGDRHALGTGTRWLSRLSWFLGRDDDAVRYATRAIEVLEPLGVPIDLAMAYSNRAQLCMLRGDDAGTTEWGGRALALARRCGSVEVEMHALNNLGTSALTSSRAEQGHALLTRSLDLAIANDAHEHAARAYTNLVTSAIVSREHAYAERVVREALAYCEDRDLDSWGLYMSAWQARALAERGHTAEAGALAERVLAAPQLADITRVVAACAAAQVRLRVGADASALLDEAWAIAVPTGESQRLVPAAAARAEAAWLAGRAEDARPALLEAWAVATAQPRDWELGELAWWLRVAGADQVARRPLPEPFAAMLAGRWTDAARLWLEAGCPLWAALALGRAPGLEDGQRALELALASGAPAVAARLREQRRQERLAVPRGPRDATRASAALLTARESEVLALLADGASDADIAAALVLSRKTVGHHVSAILRKLGEPTRSRAVATAARTGLLGPRAT